MRIFFAVAEAYPFAKVGGLADVGASLPKALARLGHDVRLILPGYPCVGEAPVLETFDVAMGRRREPVELRDHGTHHGVRVLSAANARHFERELIYGYPDDDARFVLFSKAVVAACQATVWTPDVVHCNDWHTGLVPQSLADTPVPTVLTIHNLMYQGPLRPAVERLVPGDGTMLARGIGFADEVNTVSRRYREEILTPEHGMGLEQLLGRVRLRGILNGVDYEEYDPRHDTYIAANYGPSTLEDKALNKSALQERSRLPVDPAVPLLGMVARLVDQKGFDMLCTALDDIAALGAQVVVMGVGEDHYRDALVAAAERLPHAVAYHPTDHEAVARMTYAGSDLFLAPSAYEPCGLGALIAMRYGSIPVVRRTGGLAETIHDYADDPSSGLGFGFVPSTADHLLRTISTALDVYHKRMEWESLQRRAMAADFSWEHSSLEYVDMYTDAIRRRALPADLRGAPEAIA